MVARRHARGGRRGAPRAPRGHPAAGATGRVWQALGLALIGLASVFVGAVVIGPLVPGWLGQSPPERPQPAVAPREPEAAGPEGTPRPRIEVRPAPSREPPPEVPSVSVAPKRPALAGVPSGPPRPAPDPAPPAGEVREPAPPESGSPLYRVRVGRELTRQEAEALRDHLLERGVAPSPVVLPLGDGFTVQVGAFRDPANAGALVERLRAEALNPRVESSPP